MTTAPAPTEAWPALPFAEIRETCATLQLWTQIVGKIRLVKTPWLNHSWQVTLYVTTRGLTTSPIPDGERTFEITFDFLAQTLRLETSDGPHEEVPLVAQPVAAFHAAVMAALARLGVAVRIHPRPNELPDPVPFPEDHAPRVYDPAIALKFWRALVQIDRVFKAFRTGFIGKSSPVHFFWGGADLAVTRFSGRPAPLHKGGVPYLPDAVAREAYSHEVSSAGFWPGGGAIDYPAFYSYAYPEPAAFRTTPVRPAAAFYHPDLGEFLLSYEAVRQSPTPDAALLEFLQSTYDAAANAGAWDRAALECDHGVPCVPRAIATPR